MLDVVVGDSIKSVGFLVYYSMAVIILVTFKKVFDSFQNCFLFRVLFLYSCHKTASIDRVFTDLSTMLILVYFHASFLITVFIIFLYISHISYLCPLIKNCSSTKVANTACNFVVLRNQYVKNLSKY